MKKLNITKERFEKSKYFQRKYGKLEYVSESGKLFRTSKGQLLKFNEAANDQMEQSDGQFDADKFTRFTEELETMYNEALPLRKKLDEIYDRYLDICMSIDSTMEDLSDSDPDRHLVQVAYDNVVDVIS